MADEKKSSTFAGAPAGSGENFQKCIETIMKTGKSRESAEAICAEIGRRIYGKAGFQKMAAEGKK